MTYVGVDAVPLARSLLYRPGRRRLREPEPYRRLVDSVAGQLAMQVSGHPGAVLAVMPVVGFGEQATDVVAASLAALAAVPDFAAAVVVLVNRPVHQPADRTVERVRRWRDRHPEVPVVIADVALAQRPRLGELRQLGLDAADLAWGPPPDDAALLFVDDDLVTVPHGAPAALRIGLRTTPLVLGPVLFDHPELPTCLLPDLYTGDLFRALLTDDLLGSLHRDPLALASRAVESLVLSGNLAVRRDALAEVGGMQDLNELTELARDLLAAGVTGAGTALARSVSLTAGPDGDDPVERLRRLAVRVHSRRALAAYASCGAPTVAQWRAKRLRSSSVDPVRTDPPALPPVAPLRCMPHERRRRLVAAVDEHLAVVLDHVQPTPESARRMLAVLGLSVRDVDVRPPEDGAGWRVRVRRSDGLVERLVEVQTAELADRPWPVRPPHDGRLLG